MNKSWIILSLVAISAAAQANIIIDDFSTGNYVYNTSADTYTSQTGITAIAPTRYVAHDFVANPNSRPIRTEVTGGKLFISTGSNVNAKLNFNYMDSLKSSVPAQGTGLLGLSSFNPGTIDISSESAFKFDYENNDQNNTMIYVYAWNSDFTAFNASAGYSVAAGNGSLTIPYSAVFTSVNPNSIGMLGFGVLAPTSNDITLTNVAAVPEPASMIALGAGLLALARRRRSK